MDNAHQLPPGLAEALAGGCGYTEHTFDLNLIAALDKLGEQFGPLGVAMAAATRTEPEALGRFLGEAFAHQRELWSWLVSERYVASEDVPGEWVVIDTTKKHGEYHREVGSLVGDFDLEDAAHALASHLNRKITLAKVAQATEDNSAPRAAE